MVSQIKTAVKKTVVHHTPQIVEEMVSILIINIIQGLLVQECLKNTKLPSCLINFVLLSEDKYKDL